MRLRFWHSWKKEDNCWISYEGRTARFRRTARQPSASPHAGASEPSFIAPNEPCRETHMEERGRAAIVVLGDLGRSPRMQYHALSLANQAKLEVDVIAYAGSEPHAALIHHPNIHLHLMQSPIPQGLPRALYLVALPWKMAVQLINLLWILCARIRAPTFFLVQNPPSIPTLAVVKWVCWIKKSPFIIDWHNFGYTLLGLSLGASHPFVKLYFWCEKYYGRTADGHICVTKAMQHELAQNWGIQATVLYDRSPDFFHPTSLEEKHELFCRLQQDIKKAVGIQKDCCCEDFVGDSKIMQDMDADKSGVMLVTQSNVYLSSRCLDSGQKEQSDGQGYSSSKNVDSENSKEFLSESELTLFTGRSISARSVGNQREISEEDPIWLREDRPALIISSTSWTADEDFSMLLEAAVCYDRRVGAIMGERDLIADDVKFEAKNSLFPRLLIIVTGKGPMREEYEKRMHKLRLRRVAFRTMWVSAQDYPLLLGSADLGVCLHTSSSGLDLPMKVVDMFGCGLPVCAVSYSCIGELVKDRVNGLLFSSSSELADQFLDLFRGFPYSCYLLNQLRNGALISGSSTRWEDEWEKQVIPLITQIRDLKVPTR